MVEENYGKPWGWILFCILIIILVVSTVAVITYDALTTERIVVEGEIIKAEYVKIDEIGFVQYSILRVTFDNNETYDIVLKEDYYDFTVHSHMILELRGNSDSNRWYIERVIKVPSED